MSLVLAIVVIAVTALTSIAVIAVFVWAAVKDGRDEEARRARVIRRRYDRGGRVT